MRRRIRHSPSTAGCYAVEDQAPRADDSESTRESRYRQILSKTVCA